MSAGFVSLLSFIALIGASGVACVTRERKEASHAAALVAGALSAAVLTASSLILLQDWPERMAHFDFAAFSQTERGKAQGQFFPLIFLPYELAALGAVATVAFAWLTYSWARERGVGR